MKKIDEMLYEIVKKMDKTNQPIGRYKDQIDFVYELEEETMNLLKLLQTCYFFNVDYHDGIVFKNKFCSIYTFLSYSKKIKLRNSFRKLLSDMGWGPDGFSIYLCNILEENIEPKLVKIYEELLGRGIYKY